MDIDFRSKKLRKIFNSEKELIKKFGDKMAKAIEKRMIILKAANTLNDVPHTPPYRRHQLKGDRKDEFAVDLDESYRLVFIPNHNPFPLKEDGGLDLARITAIIIETVEDYHE